MNETNLPPCPSAARLRASPVGVPAAAATARIAPPVLDCEPCGSALRSLDGLTDGLLQSLNGLDPDREVSAPLPEALLRVARGAGRPAGTDPRPDVSLDSGRRLAQMLGEGACRLGRFE